MTAPVWTSLCETKKGFMKMNFEPARGNAIAIIDRDSKSLNQENPDF